MLKDATVTEKMLEKEAGKRKKSMIAHRQPQTCMQPFDLCSGAYRSLPGNQDVFSLLISYIAR